jgi:uncharacterized damage-inducible protein DinB
MLRRGRELRSKEAMTSELTSYFFTQWSFLRGLTMDLIAEITDEELTQSPHPTLGPWWKQFRHVGRVQENYITAIQTGKVDFSSQSATYDRGASKTALIAYLRKLDDHLHALVISKDAGFKIDWFGELKPLGNHLLHLCDHETLHHGQWMTYRAILGGKFPESWRVWGV